MPELPEVETIVRTLRLSLPGRQFSQAQVLWSRTLANLQPEPFSTRLARQRILSVNRRGKFLVMQLSSDALLIHLRMSGDLRITQVDAAMQPHDRVLMDFTDGARLAFNDARKFGRIWLVEDAQPVLGSLGPEPLNPELLGKEFTQRMARHKRKLKPLLLDQSFLAGLGNIYTDEALHLAKLHPACLASSLSAGQGEGLLHAIRSVLEEGIRRNGASIDWVYRGGDFQNYFRVYQRTGQPCLECGTPIQRIVMGQRGTHICPVCQPAPQNNGG